MRIRYEAPRTLSRFLHSDAFVRCIVGPVGSGKSSVCVIEILKRAAAQDPGPDGVRRTRWAIIRNTYPQLRDTTRKTFEQWIPASLGRWHEQSFSFVIDRDMGDGTRISAEVLFRALDRPEDVKKLLSLELTGAYINEAREVPKNVFDVLQTRVGRYPSKAQGGATWFGIWMDTNPWHTGHWGYKLFSKRQGIPEDQREDFALFEQPGGRTERAENTGNLPPGYYDRLLAGKDSEWVKSYVDGDYPASDRGAIFGDLIDKTERAGRILDFDHPNDGVYVSFDLGFTDSTAAWLWRIGSGGGVDAIDYFEDHGKPLSFYFDALDAKGYKYATFWLPHDARAKSLQTGASIVEQFVARYGADRVRIGPALSLLDGIQAARWLLERPCRFHATKAATGLEVLREYRYAYDEDAKTYSTRPEHNHASHCGDAWRYVAVVVRSSDLTRNHPDNAKSAATSVPQVATLGNPWDE